MKRCLALWLLLGCLPAISWAQTGYAFGRNKIQYTQFDWHILPTAHFDVYYYPEMRPLAEIGAAYAEAQYAELQNRFQFTLSTRVPLIFYATNLHFKQTTTTDGFIPDGVGGFFEFLKGRVVLPANGDLNRFKRVIRHELVHVFTFNKLTRILRDHRKPPDRLPPLWLTEGIAEYWSGEADEQHEMVLRDLVASNTFVPLEDLDRIAGTYQMYKQGEAFCRFVAETWGDEFLLRIFENSWRDVRFSEVLELTLHRPFREIGATWEQWVKAQYFPKLAESAPPSRVGALLFRQKGTFMKPVGWRDVQGQHWVFAYGNTGSYSNLYRQKTDSLYRPMGRPEVLVRGERSERFEAFHFFESALDVSADGQVAFVTKSGEQDVLHVYDLYKRRIQTTIRLPELVAMYSPSWNPDGTKLVFIGLEKSGFSDLYTVDIRDKHLEKLTNDPFDDRNPDWSPDGQTVVFSSDRAGGSEGNYHIFEWNFKSRQIRPMTFGSTRDYDPKFSPDGQQFLFIRAEREADGKWSAQNAWVKAAFPEAQETRVTRITSVLLDADWAPDNVLLATTMEQLRFQSRAMGELPQERRTEQLSPDIVRLGEKPVIQRFSANNGLRNQPYRKKFGLDAAQTVVNQNQVYGVNGAGYVVFSDLMGQDYLLFTMYNTARSQSQFLRSMSFSATRMQIQKRTTTAYGVYRVGGLRYDLTDPDAVATYPVFWESEWGGFGAVSYPLTFFDRLEISTGLAWNDKNIPLRQIRRKALLLSNSVSFVHDSALYGWNGPIEGWRANFLLGYSTDVWRSNVSYYHAIADLRGYWRIRPTVTWANRAMGRISEGKEARLFYMGGTWDLRGFPLFDIRGRKTWLASSELRFSILENPALWIPVLEPFGIVNLRGALFADAGHAWNADYRFRESQLWTGETLGATGLGLRMNMFGGLVLRYDLGWRWRDDFRVHEPFRQFLFGWDF